MKQKEYSINWAGKLLKVTLGAYAQQAHGSVLVQYGETTVLVTAVMSEKASSNSWFPLMLAYEERYYAAGKIKGSKWIKRETRPSDEAVLSRRLIDRAIRPRFNQSIRNEIQVVVTVLSFDGINDPDIPALFGASLALMISDIPFDGPVAGIRIGCVNGELVFNPSYAQLLESNMDIVVAGTDSKMNMLEAGLKIVSEQETADAITAGFKEMQPVIEFQKKIAQEVGKPKREVTIHEPDQELVAKVKDFIAPRLQEKMYSGTNKSAYINGINECEAELKEFIEQNYADDPDLSIRQSDARDVMEHEIDRLVHENVVKYGKRLDGRATDELRDISAYVGVLPHIHGSGVFNRGNTQAMSILTLASPGMEQWKETMEIDLTKERFMHHYVFPPFSVGETGRVGFPGGREIGHGALAEKALRPIIPSKEEFPYTIRVVSEILSSNGSSSMASVCGSTLALMDGGVPIKTPAAGIAMGLMLDANGTKHKILTDIQGPEDHHGDMDLKVAGTKDGITALQMDVKVEGIDHDILLKTLIQAKKARLEILEVMTKTINEPRSKLSDNAPRVKTIKIDPDKIGMVIGSQGKVINGIIDETGATIDLEDDGQIFITSEDPKGMAKAIAMIEQITYEPKVGDEFDGKVVKLMDFGAFVEYLPGKDGMVHVSQIVKERINKPSDVLKLGQVIHVWVKEIDEYGRINLTMLDPKDRQNQQSNSNNHGRQQQPKSYHS